MLIEPSTMGSKIKEPWVSIISKILKIRQFYCFSWLIASLWKNWQWIRGFIGSYLIFQNFENHDYIEQNWVFDFLRTTVMVNLHSQKISYATSSSKQNEIITLKWYAHSPLSLAKWNHDLKMIWVFTT